jgi:hypothetical protein
MHQRVMFRQVFLRYMLLYILLCHVQLIRERGANLGGYLGGQQRVAPSFKCTLQEKAANGKVTLGSENTLARWEFLEALVRIAIAKFGKGIATSSPAEAVEMLMKQHIESKVAPAARVDLNWFRTNHLYCEPVDELFKKHEAILRALYSRWLLRPPSGGLRTKVLQFLTAMQLCLEGIKCSSLFSSRE